MAKRRQLSWVVIGDGTNPDYPWGFACKRCGARERFPRSIPLSVFLEWSRHFTRMHKGCQGGTGEGGWVGVKIRLG